MLEQDLIALDKKKEVIEGETVSLLEERQNIEDILAPILKSEQEARTLISLIEKREQSAKSPEERRSAERERWEAEDKRSEIEEKKWVHKESLNKVLTAISAKEIGHKSIVDEELAIAGRIHALETEAQRRDLLAQLEKIKASRGEAEAKLLILRREIEMTRALLHETSEKETRAETRERETDDAMRTARTFVEERSLSAERKLLEVQRREAEGARWKTEDELQEKGASAEEIEKTVQAIAKEEEDIVAKIEALK